MLRLEDKSFRLEDNHTISWKIGWQIAQFLRLSASLYCAYNVRVTAKMEDMVDFFSYSIFISSNSIYSYNNKCKYIAFLLYSAHSKYTCTNSLRF